MRKTTRSFTRQMTTSALVGIGVLFPLGLTSASAEPAALTETRVATGWCADDLNALDDQLRSTGFGATAAHHLADVTRLECAGTVASPTVTDLAAPHGAANPRSPRG